MQVGPKRRLSPGHQLSCEGPTRRRVAPPLSASLGSSASGSRSTSDVVPESDSLSPLLDHWQSVLRPDSDVTHGVIALSLLKRADGKQLQCVCDTVCMCTVRSDVAIHNAVTRAMHRVVCIPCH